jgi:hypothetical protein
MPPIFCYCCHGCGWPIICQWEVQICFTPIQCCEQNKLPNAISLSICTQNFQIWLKLFDQGCGRRACAPGSLRPPSTLSSSPAACRLSCCAHSDFGSPMVSHSGFSCRWCLWWSVAYMSLPMMPLFCLSWAYVIFLRLTLPMMPLFCLNWAYVIFMWLN